LNYLSWNNRILKNHILYGAVVIRAFIRRAYVQYKSKVLDFSDNFNYNVDDIGGME